MTYHLHLMSISTPRSVAQRLNREQDPQDVPRVRADFPRWLFWPGPARTCFAIRLRIGVGELTIVKASSPADLRDLLATLTAPAPAHCPNQTTPTTTRPHQHRCRR